MKIVKIGRSSSNDVVIQDNQVSRAHCQIIEDYGQFTIIDTNSTNGVFINGMRMRTNGQQPLRPTDIVRIGNTTLNWTQYFPDPSGNGTGTGTGTGIGTGAGPVQPRPGFSVLSLVSFIISVLGSIMLVFTLAFYLEYVESLESYLYSVYNSYYPDSSVAWIMLSINLVLSLVGLILGIAGVSSTGKRGRGFGIAALIISGLCLVNLAILMITLAAV